MKTTEPAAHSRRAILASGGSVLALGALSAPAHAESSDVIQFDQAHDDLAISLWEERSALRPQFIAASRAISEATARLPDWAKMGPCYLNHDGSLSGPVSGWPAIQDMEPPDRPGVFRLIRIGPEDIRRHFDHGFFTDEQRSKVMSKKRSELAKRRREQRAEERRAGVLAANWAEEVLFRRLDAIDEKISALPITTPNAAAVHVLRTAMFNASSNDKIGASSEIDVALKALEFLRPQLRGIVENHAGEWLDNPDLRVKCCKAYVYGDEEKDIDVSQTA